jgi:hypothetical protein
VNDVENRLTAALNALAEEAEIDRDAWQQNEDRLLERPRTTARRYLTMSGIGLVAASVAAVVAIAVWPHGHGSATPAEPTPTPTITPAPSKPTPSTGRSNSPGAETTTPPPATSTGTASAENLPIPDDVRQQLVTAFVAAKKVQPSEVSGTKPGTVYYGYLPATDTYWAVAEFSLSPSASEQTKIDFQDGADQATFHRQAGQPWQVTIGDIPWPCPGDLPDAMMSAWNMSISPGCDIVSADAPGRIDPTTGAVKPTTIITLSDGTYYGFFEALDYTYGGTGGVLFDPYTWSDGGAVVDNQRAALGELSLNSRTTTKYVAGSGSDVTEGVFDTAFARRVAAAMPQFVDHPSYGYVITVQNQQITSVTEIGPNNPMPASHPSYIEPTN